MKIKIVDKEGWKILSEQAHLVVFNEHKSSLLDRIDYAIVTTSDDDIPTAYVTCREFDSETLYFQYGGAFPNVKGTPESFFCFEQAVSYARHNYKRVTMLVENDNIPMLKFAMRAHFRIIGVRNFKGHVLLEHILEFSEEK